MCVPQWKVFFLLQTLGLVVQYHLSIFFVAECDCVGEYDFEEWEKAIFSYRQFAFE